MLCLILLILLTPHFSPLIKAQARCDVCLSGSVAEQSAVQSTQVDWRPGVQSHTTQCAEHSAFVCVCTPSPESCCRPVWITGWLLDKAAARFTSKLLPIGLPLPFRLWLSPVFLTVFLDVSVTSTHRQAVTHSLRATAAAHSLHLFCLSGYEPMLTQPLRTLSRC
jgi:hypothetical protein